MKKILLVFICILFLTSGAFAQDNSSSASGVNSGSKRPHKINPPGVPPPGQQKSSVNESGSGETTRRISPSAAPGTITPPAKPTPSPMTPGKVRELLSKSRLRPQEKEENYIILNFDNAELKDVINTVASITEENFILTPGVDARITIHSSRKIPISEVMNIFESVLEVNGMSLVRSGEFYKIVPGTAAKQKPIEVRKGARKEDIPDVDRIVTQIVPVNYVPATEVSTVLTPLLSQFGSITPNPRNNLLIINDLSSNIRRLLEVMKEIDVNAFQNTRMFFFKPKYSDVLTLSTELTEVLNALNLAGEGLAIVPIERINSLVVFSSSKTLMQAVQGWIKRLDEEVVSGQNVFVYPVQNVKAEDIADILRTLYEVTNTSKPKITSQRKQPSKTKSRRIPTRTRSVSQQGGGSRVEIITFEPTNSLVILAPPGIYREIVQTIKKIDVYPREVLIEAVIAEVSLGEGDEHGVQWSILHNVEIESRSYNGLVEGSFSNATDLFTSAPALAGGSSGLTYVLFRPEKITALIRALASESKVNILSSPRLLVRDQEEANIEVGSEIPTATSTTSTTTTDTLTQSIEYRTVGIKLKIKPTISEEKTVVLDLEQEVSNKGDDQQVGQTGNLFPSFDTTKTKTSIVVPDKQGIVIGGIIQEEKEKSYQGIPLISKLPIFGPLFRYNVNKVTKKELVIIITPYVIADRSEADHLTKTFILKLRELKEFLAEKGKEINVPVLKKGDIARPDES